MVRKQEKYMLNSEKVIVVGDLHLRSDSLPHKTAAKSFLHYLKHRVKKEGDVSILFLGDLFHVSNPYPQTYALFNRFAQEVGVDIHILAGNHDYAVLKGSEYYSVQAIEDLPNVEVIYSNRIDSLYDGSTLAFLPWFYECEKHYSELGDEYVNADYVAYHFPDETQKFGGKESKFDISYLNGTRIGGDIHVQSKNYVGVPFPTRYDERGQQGRLYVLDKGKLEVESLPMFMDYKDIEYGSDPPDVDYPIILTILNSPSTMVAKEKYKDYPIRLVKLATEKTKKKDGGESETESVLNRSAIEFFKLYKEKEASVSEDVDKKVSELLSKHG